MSMLFKAVSSAEITKGVEQRKVCTKPRDSFMLRRWGQPMRRDENQVRMINLKPSEENASVNMKGSTVSKLLRVR